MGVYTDFSPKLKSELFILNLSIYLEKRSSINEYVNRVNDITVGCDLFCHPATSSNHFFLTF